MAEKRKKVFSLKEKKNFFEAMSAGRRQVDLATVFDIATILNENNKTLKLLRCL